MRRVLKWVVGMLVAAARPPARLMAALCAPTAESELRGALALAELGRPGPAADGAPRAALRRVGGVLTQWADEADGLAGEVALQGRLARRLRALAGEIDAHLDRGTPVVPGDAFALGRFSLASHANDDGNRILVMDFENTFSSEELRAAVSDIPRELGKAGGGAAAREIIAGWPPWKRELADRVLRPSSWIVSDEAPPTPPTTPTCQGCGCQTIDADAEPRPRCHRCQTDWNGLFTERKDGQGYEDGIPRKEGRCASCGGAVYSHRGEMPLSCSGCASDF